jgi:hypothetical protein
MRRMRFSAVAGADSTPMLALSEVMVAAFCCMYCMCQQDIPAGHTSTSQEQD